MNNIVDVFKESNFNEQTLELLGNFIEEFDDLFGKYVPRDELIKRIKRNFLSNIEFTNFEKSATMGRYMHNEKRVLIKEDLPQEMLKSVFFHEMILCITNREMYIGFPRGLSAKYMYSEETMPIRTATGITEGFTEYVNKIRNEKYGNAGAIAYPILREQTENLADIIGTEKFFDIAFNNPEQLYNVMIDEEIADDQFDVDTFLTNFDIIHRFEEEIMMEKMIHQKISGKEALLMDILGVKDLKRTKIDEAKSGIITTLLARIRKMPIYTKEGFEEIQELITKYTNQLDLKDNYETCSIIFDKITELEEDGMPRKEIFEMLPEESRKIAETEFAFRDLMELETEELLEKMANPSTDLYDDLIAGKFEKHYGSKLVQKIFPYIDDENIGFSLALSLTDTFSKTILEKGWNPKLMSFEIIDFDIPLSLSFNVYETDGEDIRYLATFSDLNQKYNLEEMKVCQATEKLKLLEENPNLDANSVLLVGKSGSVLSYNGEDNYSYVSDEKDFYTNEGRVDFFLSEAEQNQRLLKVALERYKRMSEIRAPQIILDSMEKTITDRNNQRKSMKMREKFIPKDIEEATEKITLEGINKLLEELSEPLQTRKESLEKGIGYDE